MSINTALRPAFAPHTTRHWMVAVAALALSACNRSPAPTAPPQPASAPAAAAASTAPAAVAAEGTSIERLDPALDAVIAPGAVVEKIAGGFGFLEGPVWVNGELWFSDLTGNKLHAVKDNGEQRLVLDKSGGKDEVPAGSYQGSNGAAVDQDGSVLLAQHGARRIARVAADMTVTSMVDRTDQGKRINSPNDMTFAPDGALWFTDPPFGLPGMDKDPEKETAHNAVYRFADGKALAMITDLPTPNGIAFSPDGTRLYVSNSMPEMFVNVYDVGANGAVSNGRPFISFPGPAPAAGVPDGIKVDSLSNVWLTGPGGIRIVSADGKLLGQIKSPDAAQANLAWGGSDWSTVYITATSNVYRLKLAAPGHRPLYGK